MCQKDITKADLRFLKLAISLGYRNLGQTWPNPSVGCVVVNDGIIVGTGCTGIGGRPHAEIVALKEAGRLSKGATVYTTLEPCSHFGKTPPCSIELIKANVKRVVCPLIDPDPRVDGNGFSLLKKHGVKIDRSPILISEIKKLSEGYLKVRIKNKPFIALKLALSLNGKIATKSNQSNWISGHNSRNFVHLLRSRYDAVMVGKKTALVDNPNLNLRGQFSNLPPPVKIILDSDLSLPKTSNFAKNLKSQKLIIVHNKEFNHKASRKWNEDGVKTIGVTTNKQTSLNLKDLSLKLMKYGLTSILVEGGGEIATSLIKEKLLDRLILFTAGTLLDKRGIDGFNPSIPLNTPLSDHPRFVLESSFQIGNDVAHFWHTLND